MFVQLYIKKSSTIDQGCIRGFKTFSKKRAPHVNHQIRALSWIRTNNWGGFNSGCTGRVLGPDFRKAPHAKKLTLYFFPMTPSLVKGNQIFSSVPVPSTDLNPPLTNNTLKSCNCRNLAICIFESKFRGYLIRKSTNTSQVANGAYASITLEFWSFALRCSWRRYESTQSHS